MSRPAAALMCIAALLSASSAAIAQESQDHGINAMITTERQTFGPPPPKRQRCVQGNIDEIVVCAPDHGEDQRVPSTSESDPGSREALRDGRPHAPQLDSGSCRGQPGCHIGGRVPPPVYY